MNMIVLRRALPGETEVLGASRPYFSEGKNVAFIRRYYG